MCGMASKDCLNFIRNTKSSIGHSVIVLSDKNYAEDFHVPSSLHGLFRISAMPIVTNYIKIGFSASKNVLL